MKTYVITCTGDRPEALKLCNHYMQRQGHQDFTWIVADDSANSIPEKPKRCDTFLLRKFEKPGGHSLLGNLRFALMHILQAPGPDPDDLVLIVEDDDWYHAGYIGMMQHYARVLPPEIVLFGESHTRYYNVRWRTYRHNDNAEWASLCATCFKASFIPDMLKIAQNADPDRPFIDVIAFTENAERAHLFLTDFVCGIKGMPGRTGIGHGHTEACKRLKRDPWLETLRDWTGPDCERYRDFYHSEELKDIPIPQDQRHEPWAIQEMKQRAEGESGICCIFRQPGVLPDLTAFAAGAFAHGYLNEFRDIADARLSHFPPANLAVISGGFLRHGGLNGKVFEHYRAIGVPVVICDPGRVVKNAQRIYVNREHWLPPTLPPRNRIEHLGLMPNFQERGTKILIAGQRPDLDNQLRPALEAIKAYSDRQIVFRPHPNTYHGHERPLYDLPYDRVSVGGDGINEESRQTLNEALCDAWCVVTHSSIVGAEALLKGIPVICSDDAVFSDAGVPLEAACDVEKLGRPNWEELYNFLRRWSYTIWYESELRSGQAFSYLKEFIK